MGTKKKINKSSIQTKMSKPLTSKAPFYIVGVGASAGGLEALEKFFDSCPADTGAAFVVVQHLSPDYKSLMTELLSRHTKMVVEEAKHDEVVQPDHIYLIPRNKNLTVESGTLKLYERPAKNHINFSIDIFFHSLAAAQKEMAIGIILSGTGSDGTRGGKSIKEVGGTVFVQKPESGRFDGMTRSAINHGLADYILTPEEMPTELVQFISHPVFTQTMMTGLELGKDIEAMDRILKIIKNHTGYDFFSYKKPTLLRRTAKRMNITKCETIEDYIDHLYQTTEEKFTLVEEFLIGVTKFFRDTEAYHILEEQVIPDIVDAKKARKQAIKIWVVACSTGEEAYSLAILFEEYLERKKLDVPYKIFATDIDGKSIDIAARGIYPANISLDISSTKLSKYFIKIEDKFQIHPRIRKNIIFSKHDILQHPPFNKMDLVSCRNMLIYIDNPAQVKILASLHYSLNMNGYLFMGSSESIGLLNKNFSEVSNKWKIYRNIHPTKMVNMSTNSTWQVERSSGVIGARNRQSQSFGDKVNKLITATLMEEYDAVSVCIDKNFEIIQASGKFSQYINIPEEGFSNNLQKLLPDELNLPINSGIRRLQKAKDEPIVKNIKLIVDDKVKHLRIIMQGVNIVLSEPVSFLITILEKVERSLTPEEEVQSSDLETFPRAGLLEEIGELKEALHETRENLQATIEELETSNEEMQATNEELLASNEELQSTNEELQSLNEELHTVNAELQEKNLQLLELNADIENLMVNINIGTIFLDKDLAVRKFTPDVKEHFQLREDDIGRPISHFSGNVGDHDLVLESQKVLQTLKPFKAEFQNTNGLWFMVQIFPYRTQNDMIRGVVINFINIDELKKASNEKEQLNNYISYLADSSPIIIYVYDLQKQINVFSTNSIFEIAGYAPAHIKEMGATVLEQIVHPEDFPNLLDHQEALKNLEDGELAYLEYRIIHRTTKEAIWILSADKVNERDEDGNVVTVLGVAQNISEVKVMKNQLNESEERARLAIAGTGAGLWEWTGLDQDEAWWSEEFYQLLGFTPQNRKASRSGMLALIHPDHIKNFERDLKKHLQDKKSFEMELLLKTKHEEYRWFKINLQAQWDKKGNTKKVVGTLLDINDQHNLRAVIKEKQEKQETIYRHAPVGIMLFNLKAEFLEVSKGFTRILGYTEAEIIGKNVIDITHKEDIALSLQHHEELRKGITTVIQIDKRFIAKDKSVVWGQIRVKPVRKSSGEIYLVGILSDMNEEKKAENKMKRLNEELERFAYLASHDLKEPLRTITSLTERLTEKYGDDLEEGALRYIQFIENASSRMETLTSELLTYSQLGHNVKNHEEINLNELINQIETNLHTSIKENQVVLTVDELPVILGDPIQIELLLQNLISNSIKYRKKVTPQIKISYKDKGDMWEFAIKDNGIGIDKEYHEKIFEVFKRLHNKNEYEGTGIGLSNCKRIVSNHQGEIWVRSTPRRGATFFFSIPKEIKKTNI